MFFFKHVFYEPLQVCVASGNHGDYDIEKWCFEWDLKMKVNEKNNDHKYALVSPAWIFSG
jgi:hypothetical protein